MSAPGTSPCGASFGLNATTSTCFASRRTGIASVTARVASRLAFHATSTRVPMCGKLPA